MYLCKYGKLLINKLQHQLLLPIDPVIIMIRIEERLVLHVIISDHDCGWIRENHLAHLES